MTATTTAEAELEVAILGSGFSGLAMGHELRRAGIASFAIFEKGDDVGGTWRENTYPGAACDIPSHLYSLSTVPNPSWTRAFSGQKEILAYMQHAARELGLVPHLRFRKKATAARYDEDTARWTVEFADGTAQRARFLVLGIGGLHIPAVPDFPGLSSFAGTAFHSAEWNHDYDLRGKRVAVIGTGASAIQFIPEIVRDVAKLHVFQRTPAWIIPKPDRPIGGLERAAFRAVPGLQKVHRAGLYWQREATTALFAYAPGVLERLEPLMLDHLRRQVKDPVLREKLRPDYRMGCKRVLPSNDFYRAIQRPNVELVTDPIERIEPSGVRTRDGVLREVDCLLMGTGFKPLDSAAGVPVFGPGGRALGATWGGTPKAYYGIHVAGFPNLFVLLGPNTALGTNSIVFMIEAQARHARKCIELVRARRAKSIDARERVQERFNAELQRRLRGTVWATGCSSYYLAPNGTNFAIWPGLTAEYWLRTRRVNPDDYVIA